MSKVHICLAYTKGTASSFREGLSSFSSNDMLFWWDSAPEGENSNFCLSSWCHAHSQNLCQIIASFMQTMGREKVQGREVQEWFSLDDDLSHWYTSLLFEKHPKILPHLFEACKLYAFTRLVQERTPSCTHFVVHVQNSSLQEALKAYCREQNIQLTITPAAKIKKFLPLSLKNYFNFLPLLCQSMLRFGHWLYIMRRLLQKKPAAPSHRDSTQKHATIATYFPNIHKDLVQKNIFRSHYWEDLHALLEPKIQNKECHVHWLFIRVNSAQYSLRQCIKLKEYFQKNAHIKGRSESFYYVEEFLRFKDIKTALSDYMRLKKRATYIEADLQNTWRMPQSNCSLWPFFRTAWQQSFGGWRCLERCIQQRAFKAYAAFLQLQLQDKKQHQYTLFPWENCPWERRLTEAMRKKFVHSKVYAAQHSSLRIADFRYFDGQEFFAFAKQNSSLELSLPHFYCLNGNHALKAIQEHIPAEKIFLVEALRYRYLQHVPKLTSIAPIKHLVLITSYFAPEVQAQMQTLAKWWKQNYAQPHFTGNIYIKAHPHLAVEPFLQKHGLNPHNFIFITQSMQNFWQQVHIWQKCEENALLWLANSTTVTLEAAHLGMPLCVQGAVNDFNLCPLDGSKHLTYVYTAQDLQRNLLQAPKAPLEQKFFSLQEELEQWKALL